MKKYYWIIALAFFTNQNLFAQRVGRDMPPNGSPGKCHAKCDPNDCMVWSLVEEKPEPMVLEIDILADTSQTDEFIYEYFLIEGRMRDLEKHTEWREVVCNHNITESIISEIQEKLSEEGYYLGNPTTIFTSELELALFQFQKNNSLPYGQIDLETLSELGIFP